MMANSIPISEATVSDLVIAAFSRMVQSLAALVPDIESSLPPFLVDAEAVIRQHFLNVPLAHVVIEICLALWLVYIIFLQPTDTVPKKERLSEREKQELIDTWKPEPLVPKLTAPLKKQNVVNATKRNGASIVVNQRECLNFGTFNFLGLSHCSAVDTAAKKTVSEYGVGSCGPPGFYGTNTPHMDFEKVFASFLGCEEVILYSYAFSTVASAIPAYAKRGDIIYCDKGVGMPLRMGVVASRSEVKYFDHNDMDHLERILEADEKADKADKYRTKKKQRRFVVVEGLYANTGSIVDLHRLCQLRKKYRVRIFLDESYSFGVLGRTGRGVLEYFSLDISDIDMMTGSLEASLGSIGGFAAGSKYLIDHQRLSGLGYCFSASLPPLLANAAIAGLENIKANTERFKVLGRNTALFRKNMASLQEMEIGGHKHSPLVHIRLKEPKETVEAEEAILGMILEHTEANGVVFALAQYARDMDEGCPRPSIRVCISSVHTEQEVERACVALHSAANQVLGLTV